MAGRWRERTTSPNICVLLIWLRAVGLAQPQGSAESIADHFRAGQRAASVQQFEKAIAEFRTVLKLDPSLTEARANLGLMYYSTGKYDEAVSELVKVVKSSPGLVPGELFLGLSYLNLGKPSEAVTPLSKVLQLDSHNAEAGRALLACYLAEKQYERAQEQISKLQDQSSQEETLYATGEAYLEMGRTLTSRMAEQYRSSAWAHRLAGDLAADRSDWPAAVDAYRQALVTDLHLAGLHAAYRTALTEAGKTDETAAHEDISESPPSAGQILFAKDEYSQAAHFFLMALNGQESAETLYWLIRTDTALGSACFAKLQAAYPESASTHELRGQIDRLRQDFAGALVEFEGAVQKRPDSAELHRYAGEMMLLTSRVPEAEAELTRAGELIPGNAETEYLLAQVALKKKDTETAVLHLRNAEQRDPGLLEVHALLGTAYMHLDKPVLAIPELQQAQSIDSHGDLHFQLFKAYRMLGKPEEAEKALARSRELRKKSLQFAVAKISGENSALTSGEAPNPDQ